MPKIMKKTPYAELAYSFNWEDWLDGDSIIESKWQVPMGLTLVSSTVISGVRTVATISGGRLGSSYTVLNSITTAAGKKDRRYMLFEIVEKDN